MYNQDNLDNKKPVPFPLYQPEANIPYNWTVDNMSWKSKSINDIMEFNGIAANHDENSSIIPSDFPTTSNQPIRKRKNEFVEYNPTKQHISESKMAAFLNGLHISNDYQSHSINLNESSFNDEMESCNVNLTPQELEERLKNAQKIVLCDDVKKTLKETSRNEIYKVLADRIEKPCQALILWQPPKPIEKLITRFNDYKSNNNDQKEDNEEEKMVLE